MMKSFALMLLGAAPLAAQTHRHTTNTPDDYVMPDPANLVAKEPFSAKRSGDGTCDWMNARSSRFASNDSLSVIMGERHGQTCRGVWYLVKIPSEFRVSAIESRIREGRRLPGEDITIGLPSHIWEGPDTLTGRGRQARDIVNAAIAVLPKGTKVDQLDIENDTLASVVVRLSPTHRVAYPFRLSGTRWVSLGSPRTY